MTAKELGNSKVEFDGYEPNGLTKRELFAGLAMQGLLKSYFEVERWPNEDFAMVSVEMADALLEKLAKEK